MPSQEIRSQSTRAALLDTFKALLLEEGVAAATTQSVLARTGLSKGALYHHFRSKTELMEAIYEAESHGAIHRAVAKAASHETALDRLKGACAAWIDEMHGTETGRIVLELGPSALGTNRVAEIENRLSIPLFENALAEAIRTGETEAIDTALAARLINGFMAQVAFQGADHRKRAAQTIGPVIDAILVSLSGQKSA